MQANDSFCKSERFSRAHIGVCIIDIETGLEITSENADQFFVPASLQKIPLSVVALTLLGEDFVFKTSLGIDGPIENGTLKGNLWVIGGGDPTFTLETLNEWEKALNTRGIHRIEGKIIVDSSCFESALAGSQWNWEDIGNYYGAGASGLAINHNLYRITFKPGSKEGEAATIINTDPPQPHLTIYNEVTTGPAGSGDKVYVFGSEYSPVQFYRGTVPIDQPTFTIKAAIPHPAFFIGTLLNSKIPARAGVEWVKDGMVAKRSEKILYSKNSPPLKELIQTMNQFSVNLYAEHFLKAIGEGRTQMGLQKMDAFLKKIDVPAKTQDGSGLSRTNFITPRGFARLLCLIRKSPEFKSIYTSFPEQGREGTLETFLPLNNEAVLKAKTGTMSHVCNLGGYLKTKSGKEYAFALFSNQHENTSVEVHKEMHHFLNQVASKL